MSSFTIHEAKTHLSRLIERALAGEDVVVMRGREPVVAIKPLRAPKSQRRLGGLPGLVVHMAKDFDAPMSDFTEYST
jgi:antitoxin (DNA-binding transcriptional repressor) of toxin-antitoxin stability system